MAGYSGTPLIQKLGIREGARLVIGSAPEGFEKLLGKLPGGARKLSRISAPLDFAIVFARSRSELEPRFERTAAALARNGMLWVGWPKRSSGVASDLTEDVVRAIGLARGLVDVKVCAIDETWSGLKFVIRRELR